MAEELYDVDFPNLRTLGFERTSDPAYYNCIAYVAGDFKRKWWPGEYDPFMSPDYWPKGSPNEETLESFIQALASVHYEPCADGNLEAGFEKAALYALGDEIKHAALQLAGLEGPAYGKVIGFVKRPRTT